MSEEEQGTQPETSAPAPADVVERDKFTRVVAAKRSLEQQVRDLKEQNQALEEKTTSVDSLTRQLEELQGKLASAETRFDRYRSISSTVGTNDPDVIEAFEWQYGRQAQGEEAPQLGDWLEGLQKDPEAAPSVLRPFLSAEQKAEEPAKRRPSPSAGHNQPPTGRSAYSTEEIRAAQQKAMMGDTSDLQRIQKALTEGLG